jgi:hypothetical protein
MIDSTDLGFWDRIKYLFTNPNLFFNAVKYEKGIKNSIITYLITGVLFSGIIFIFSFVIAGFFGRDVWMLSSFFLALPFLILILTFLFAGLIHLIILGFKPQGGYKDTYNVYTYSMMPFLIFSLIPVIGYLSIFYSFFLMVIGISKVHDTSTPKAFLSCILPFVLIIISFSISVLFIDRFSYSLFGIFS